VKELFNLAINIIGALVAALIFWGMGVALYQSWKRRGNGDQSHRS